MSNWEMITQILENLRGTVDDLLRRVKFLEANVDKPLCRPRTEWCSPTNSSGGALAAGDVVEADPSGDESVITSTTPGDRTVAGVVYLGGPDGACVRVATGGIVTVNVTGAVSRGDGLRQSSTAKLAERMPTCAEVGGEFAIAVEDAAGPGAGSVKALLSLPARRPRLPNQWWGYCSPSNPEAKSVYVCEGRLWIWDHTYSEGYARRLSGQVYSLATVGAFVNANWYRYAILRGDLSADPVVLSLYESATEQSTAALCEAQFEADAPTLDLYNQYMPLCVLILRNNGTVPGAGEIENVTGDDEAQSYFYLRDARPYLHVHAELGSC